MRKAMPAVTDREIADGYQFHHEGNIYVAYEVPDDTGYANGYDIKTGKDYDLWFLWTCLDCWVFVSANLAEHETP